MAKILITGGAGYIGSHTALELLKEGYEVVVYDNLCNSSQESMKRVEELTGKTITFYEGDILNAETLKAMFEKEQVDAVIHCAALKAVGESVRKPLEYYQNNITGTLTLMKVMREVGVKNIVFSSSATVYGNPETMPITEDCPKGQCTNPYGWTKSMLEQILKRTYAIEKEHNDYTKTPEYQTKPDKEPYEDVSPADKDKSSADSTDATTSDSTDNAEISSGSDSAEESVGAADDGSDKHTADLVKAEHDDKSGEEPVTAQSVRREINIHLSGLRKKAAHIDASV